MVMDDPKRWTAAHKVFLDIAVDGWKLYERLKSEQFFSRLKNVRGDKTNGQKVVTKDGVPDGIVFPMLSGLGRFVRRLTANGRSRYHVDFRGKPYSAALISERRLRPHLIHKQWGEWPIAILPFMEQSTRNSP